MSPKRTPQTPREIIKRLEADGWIARPGKGDHRNFTKPGIRAVVTVDTGAREIPVGTLRSIYRATGWDW